MVILSKISERLTKLGPLSHKNVCRSDTEPAVAIAIIASISVSSMVNELCYVYILCTEMDSVYLSTQTTVQSRKDILRIIEPSTDWQCYAIAACCNKQWTSYLLSSPQTQNHCSFGTPPTAQSMIAAGRYSALDQSGYPYRRQCPFWAEGTSID